MIPAFRSFGTRFHKQFMDQWRTPPWSDIVRSMSPAIQAYDFAGQLLTSKEYFERSTRVLDDADSGYRPREGMMTVSEQVAHVAQTVDWFIDGATPGKGFDLDFEKHARATAAVTSLAEARRMLEAAFVKAVAFLRSRTPEELAQPLPPSPIMGGKPVSDVVWGIVEHTAHHRGALTVYSRALGKVPVMPYFG